MNFHIRTCLKASIVIRTKGAFFLCVGASEGEDSSCEDTKSGVENEAAKKTIRDPKGAIKQGHQPVFGKQV